MLKVQGTVKKVYENVVGTVKKYTIYNIELVLDNGNQFYLNTKFDKPKVREGDYIEAPYKEEDYKGKVTNVANARDIIFGQKPANAVASTTAVGKDVMTKDDYWRNKEANDVAREKVIRYHAARSTAVEIVNLAHTLGALPKVAKAKPDEKMDALLNEIDIVTKRLFLASENIDIKDELAGVEVRSIDD